MGNYSDKTVLVVEDQPAIRAIIAAILKTMGVGRVVEAAHGREAVNALRSVYEGTCPKTEDEVKKIDLILADWKMPHLSGLELLRTVRKSARYSTLPYVMVTCMDESESFSEAFQAGVTDYLVKPFSAKNLEKKVQRVLDSQIQADSTPRTKLKLDSFLRAPL